MATRRAQTTRESRELLLAAAAELFAEKGYRDTTFADIAERAGISRGSIPWHFGNKEGLLVAVLQRFADDLRDMADEQARSHPGRVDRIAADLAALIRRPNARLFITLLTQAFEPDSPVREQYVAIQARLRENLLGWARALPLRPGISPESFAVAVTGAAMGIHQQWRLTPEVVDLDEALAALQAMVINSLTPER